jgi:hypothetical protein
MSPYYLEYSSFLVSFLCFSQFDVFFSFGAQHNSLETGSYFTSQDLSIISLPNSSRRVLPRFARQLTKLSALGGILELSPVGPALPVVAWRHSYDIDE